MLVKVLNLATGNTTEFVGISPKEAVNAAYELNKGNHNTWTYGATLNKVITSKSGATVSRGDFAALL